MERNSRRILRRLKREGWVLESVSGSHYKLKHPDGRIVVVPHPRKDMPTGTARAIAKQAGWLED